MFMVFQNYFTYFELSQSLHVGWAKSKDHYGKTKKKHQITCTFHIYIYIYIYIYKSNIPGLSHLKLLCDTRNFENLELNSHLPEKVGALLCN